MFSQDFLIQGAKWIHVVDIDGAFDGKGKNMQTIFNIKKKTQCKIQVGGGIRDIKSIEKYIEFKSSCFSITGTTS